MPIPDTLNDRQKEAVLTTEGPVLVVAGAGAGKTKVIAERINYLIEKGARPENILAVTFTNKAAGEMRGRVNAQKTFIGTFHALGLLIIRENLEKIGVNKNFTILDEDDSLKLIKECLQEIKVDPKQFEPPRIRGRVSLLKNQLVTEDTFIENGFFEQILGRAWRLYEEKKGAQNQLDFDDLLLKPVLLFRREPELLKKYQTH